MMRGRAVVHYAIIGLLIAAYPVTGYSYNASDIEQFLSYHRTLNGNPYRTSNGENIDKAFMTDVIRREIENWNKLIDDYDDPDNPSPGYTWDIKIYHPGEIPGTLPPEGGPYPIIIICKGAPGSNKAARYLFRNLPGERDKQQHYPHPG